MVTVGGRNATLDELTITAGEGGTPFFNFGVVAERQGAGLFAPFGTAGLKLINCIFRENNITTTVVADFLGGAAYFNHEATIRDCIFIDNMAAVGGAVYIRGSEADVKFANCTFMNNTARNGGAVAELSTNGGTFENCLFANNRATVTHAGGLRSDSRSLLTNTVFYNNMANTQGGGAFFPSGGTMINCTFYNNRTNTQGGGIFLGTSATPSTLRNNLLIGNTATDNASGHQVYVNNIDAAHVVNLQNNLIAGGLTGTTAGIRYATPGAGGITEANTVDASNVATVFASIMEAEENFLRLATGSPAVNAGNNLYLNNGTPANTNDDITTDLAGRPRILDGTVDIGAYESGLQPQTIMFTPTDAGAAGTEIVLEATASSGLAVTFMITGGTGTATIADGTNTLRLTGIGTVEITATQAGNTNYAVATETQTITVSQGTQDIMFTSDGAGAAGTEIVLEATASSGLAVTFAINEEFETDGTTPATDGTVATLSGGNNLTLVGVGTVEITATQAGNANYAATTETQTITVSQGTQTIAFTSDDAGAAGTDIDLVATASSTLPVTFEITGEFETDGTTPATDGSVATLSGGTTLSLIGVGKVEITATQAGNASYTVATQMQTITVAQGTQTIAFTSDGVGTINTEIELAATASSGLAVTFAVTNQSPTSGSGDVATLADNGTTLSLTGAGTATITATQAGNANYAATTETQTITVSAIPLISQTITFTSGDTGTVGTPITLAATATSMGTVTFAVTEVRDADGNVVTSANADAVATLSGTTLTLLAAGTVTVTATQAGGDIGGTIYAPATQTQTITIMPMVVVPPTTQTITFTSPTAGTVGTPITLAATATSTGTVTFAVTEVRDADGNVVTDAAADAVTTLSGSTLTLSAAGTVTITASQAGGDIGGTTYAAATQTQVITIMPMVVVPPTTQTITFTSPAEGQTGNTITLIATATSTGVVTFAVTEVQDVDGNVVTDAAADAVVTLSGSTLTLLAAGTVTITASQAGGDIGGTIYAAATETQVITISSTVLGIEGDADGFVLYPNPTSGKLHFSERVAEFRLYGIEGRLLETQENVRSVDLTARPAGLYFAEVIRDGRSVRYRILRE